MPDAYRNINLENSENEVEFLFIGIVCLGLLEVLVWVGCRDYSNV